MSGYDEEDLASLELDADPVDGHEDLDPYDDDADDDDDDDADVDDDDADDDVDDDDADDDADDDDDDDVDDDDEDDDELEDADEDEIDFVIALYREDGQAVVTALAKELANDLDRLIGQLRRQPGDAGAIGMVSLDEEIFVITRVRGEHVQMMLSDASAALEYPIARDVADFVGVVDLPEDDDDPEPLGDLELLADLGVSGFDLGLYCDVSDHTSDQQLAALASRLQAGAEFRRVVDTVL